MKLASITGLPDNLEYTITDYNIGDKLCQNDKCSLGFTKTIIINIKYKDGAITSTSTTYNLNLNFEFKKFTNSYLKETIYTTTNATNMKSMFEKSKFLNINVRYFKTENVMDMSKMFNDCPNLETINIAGVDFRFYYNKDETTGEETAVNITHMFENCPNIKKIYVYDVYHLAYLNHQYPNFPSIVSLIEPIQDGIPT